MALDDVTLGCPQGLSAPASAAEGGADPSAFVRKDAQGQSSLDLLIGGARCAGCIRKIESALLAVPGVTDARLNLSTGRLHAVWRDGALAPTQITHILTRLGYTATPFDPQESRTQKDQEGRKLLRALAVAGFGAMNIMMFSVPVWTGDHEMGAATRTMLHWWSALIAAPVALYAGQPFFRSAFRALRRGHANMDVPISLAVALTLAMSLYDTATGGMRAYFDGVCMLLFLLLIGRYLDHQLREKARSAASDLLALQATTATRLEQSGAAVAVAARDLAVDDRIQLLPGDRAVADGVIEEGFSELDCAIISGETKPVPAVVGDTVLAGAINLSGRLVVRVTAPAESSTVAQLSRLIEIGEQGRARYVRIADRAAQLYVPVVHTLAALAFLFWIFAPQLISGLQHLGLHGALTNAVAVLIITCPCALGLAVPAVHVVATGRLFRQGVLVRTSDALERLAQIDTVVIDKTGTLTFGRARLTSDPDPQVLKAAASLARGSRHPLCRALVERAGPGVIAADLRETVGAGVSGMVDGQPARLGRRTFVGAPEADGDDEAAELWVKLADAAPIRFSFTDAVRNDAAETVAALRKMGIAVELLSGDRAAAVAGAAHAAGIERWRAAVRPEEKVAHIAELSARGARVLMVGDGLNDAAALTHAHASAAPGSAADISQAASDIVFSGAQLYALVDAIQVARSAHRRVVENLAFSALYNLIAIPVAVVGLVTPLIAALAMSGSSLIVTLNALRLNGRS